MTPLISQQLNEQLRDAMLAFYLHAFNPLHSHDPVLSMHRVHHWMIYTAIGYWMCKSVSQ